MTTFPTPWTSMACKRSRQTLADKAGLTTSLVPYDAAYIVVPGHESGTQLAINGIDAAKEAGIKFVLLLSVVPRDTDEATFEKEFEPVKDALENSGIDHAVVRLPFGR